MNELEELKQLIDERFKKEFDFLPKDAFEEWFNKSHAEKLKRLFDWDDELITDAYLK